MENSANNNELHNITNYENKFKISNKLNNIINSNTITSDFFKKLYIVSGSAFSKTPSLRVASDTLNILDAFFTEISCSLICMHM